MAQGEQAEQESDIAGLQSSLEEAAALYQGDLLPSCYADWILPEREHTAGHVVGIGSDDGFCTILVSKYLMKAAS